MSRTLVAVVLIVSSLGMPSASTLGRHAPMAALAPAPTSAPSFGLNSHLITRYPDPTSMDLPAQQVADLGVGWVREDFHWHRVQPTPGAFDWTFSDAGMRALLQRNIEVLGVLGPSVGWATVYNGDPTNDVSFHPPNPQAFAAYARAVVSRYKRYVHHWEIWNEPDHAIFWQPRPDPAAYATLLKLTAEAIREVDPEANILIGGINPFDTSFLQSVAAAGAWPSFDILAIHPYVDPWAPEDGNLLAITDSVRAISARYGPKPIWATEVGWSSGPGDRDKVGVADEQDQANYLVRSMLLLWQAGVERSFWYTLKDDPHNPYGLFAYGAGRADFSRPKPAYAAFQTLCREVKGTRFVTQRSLFDQRVLLNFEDFGSWQRTSQPNGVLLASQEQRHTGVGAARLDYYFSNSTNDYVVFERAQPLPIAGEPYAIGFWVYGDGSGQTIRIWMRDREGELLQYSLGNVGGPGWHFRSAPIGGLVEPGNVVTPGGNGRLDFPVSFAAILLDDAPDGFIGSGSIYLDDLTAVMGREAYDLRLSRDGAALDILWSPPGTPVAISTTAATARLIARDGSTSSQNARNGRLRFDLGPAPLFVWHSR